MISRLSRSIILAIIAVLSRLRRAAHIARPPTEKWPNNQQREGEATRTPPGPDTPTTNSRGPEREREGERSLVAGVVARRVPNAGGE